MKKIEISQMENLEGGGENQTCMLLGVCSLPSMFGGPELVAGTLIAAVSAGCLSN